MINPSVKAVYNTDTGKIEYQPVKSMLGQKIKRVNVKRVGGHMNVYTSEDDRDLHKEWFSKKTDFQDELGWSMVGKPILINHALDGTFKAMAVGVFDFEKEDDIGRYVEGELYEQKKYEDMLREMRQRGKIDWDDETIVRKAALAYKTVDAFFSTGKVHWSSGALPQSVSVNPDNGHIDTWARIEGSGTMTPAEPDGTEVLIKGVAPDYEYTLKNAFNELDALLIYNKSIQTAKTQGTKEPNGAKELSVQSADVDQSNLQAQGLNTMDEQMIREIIRAVLEEQKAMNDMPEEEAVPEEEVVRGIETDIAKMEEDMPEEQKSVRIAELAADYVVKKLAAAQRQREAVRNAAKTRFGAYNASLPTSDDAYLPAAKHNGQQQAVRPFEIRDITPFDNWKAEDYSFAIDLARMSRSTATPIIDPNIVTKAFMNNFADKAIKAHQSGELRISKNGMKAINSIKANELDYSTQSGYGDEWVFTAWSESIWDKPRLDLVYNQLQTVNMPSNPYELPTASTDPSVYFVAETTAETELGRNDSGAAIPDTKIATAKVQLNAKKYAMRVNWSAELDEDAVAGYLPQFRNQAQRSIEDAIELGVILGDTSASGNINYDGGTPTTTNSYLAYDGLFHQALVTATTNAVDAGGAAPTLAHIRNVRSKLGNAQGYNPANLAIFTDFPTYMKLLSIDAVVTLDKMGSQATVKTGSLGQIDGMNIFVSGQMALADTDGKITYNGNVTSTGRLMIVYLPDWYLGYRRRIASNLEYLKFADAWELVLTVRTALSARSYNSSGAQQSTDDSVAVLYNIGV